ncbi:MAG: bifunctional (p)ppGpp synthetase/guanosine-3',5'-bis(diphosphate) 3'-pyrophosphohydrolase [Ruminococcaceae bacterium]|nr:bifunctional (p)ppGpp synthetase/guanosine-3',5'-bis(diphosphate) 3'-pyrophosphohydrolase [Oscillospiraceae bacterium]
MITTESAVRALKDAIVKSEKTYDHAMIDRAITVAITAHEGQNRRSGEPYVCHPLSVATILVELGMDSEAVVAALLHDVVEDTAVELSDLRRQFGDDVAALVDGVTKITKISFNSREEQQAENIRKMLLAMSEDIRVVIIKLADRLHNMRTRAGWEEQKRRDKAKETMDIYAPLAHRLGIRAVKEELEDLSLRELDPIGYHDIEEALELRKHERDEFLAELQKKLTDRLAEYGMHPFVAGRIKSIAGIYRKMYVQGRSLDEIYDVYAIRVIVDTVNDCYNVLGIIHDMYNPLPNRFKDYISTPKPNMYQSLHTTLIGKEKIPFEVQIRTWEMHYTAEYGIAAHWKYKLGIQRKDKLEDRLAWVRQFIENQADVDDAEEIVRSIKSDFTSDDVFIFTPKGDVISLPLGSTVVDFAYAIHSAVGNRMIGAKVDGRIVPLDYQVKNSEIVEVLTSAPPGRGPSRDWLNFVRTGEARNKIRAWFKKERREENIQKGKQDLERELQRIGVRLPEDRMQELIAAQSRRWHYAEVDDFYAAIGYGGVAMSRVLSRIKDEYARIMKSEEVLTPEKVVTAPSRSHHNNGGVIIEHTDNCLVKFARCCNPLPGDDIIGFITRGYGVSVHKRDCVNVPRDTAHAAEPERWVGAWWEDDSDRSEFKATLVVHTADRMGMLADITTQLASMHVMIHALNSKDNDEGEATISLTIAVNSVEHLNTVIAKLRKITGIHSISRG